MWQHVLHLIVRPVLSLLGLFCVLTAIILYPSEEGKIQSKFEDFWIRLDDFQHVALSRHAAFMNGVARFETHFLDVVFGHKLFSFQAVAVSSFCSVVSWYLVYQIITQPFFLKSQGSLRPNAWMVYIAVGSATIASACILFKHRHFLRRTCLLFASVFIAGGLAIEALVHDNSYAYFLGKLLAPSLGFGFVCDVLFIAATRKLIRLAGEMDRSRKIFMVIGLDLLLAAILTGPTGLFLLTMSGILQSRYLTLGFLFYPYLVSQTNALDGLFAMLFPFLAAFLLIHRILWPLLTRTLFKMTDIGTKGRRAILTTVGIALLGTSVFGGKFPELIAKLIEKLS